MNSTPSLPRQSNDLEPGRKAPKRQRESGSPKSQDPPPTHRNHNTSVNNLVPIIISGVDPKFKTALLVTSELKQYDPSFNCTRVKLFKNRNFVTVSNTPKDFAVLQNESKMNAALGLVKGVSTDIKQEEFENMLAQNKTTFAKVERFISKSGTPLPMFLAELKEPAMAEALNCKKPSLPKIWHDFQGRGV